MFLPMKADGTCVLEIMMMMMGKGMDGEGEDLLPSA